MERFRGLVQRFGGGGGVASGGSELTVDKSQTEEILSKLPLTKEFVEQLPRTTILETAKQNDAKAIEALRLVHKVDALIESHATTANTLCDYVSQLTLLNTSIDQATLQAKSLQQQLTTLETMVLNLESQHSTAEILELQRTEDAKFEAYARSRRVALENKKAEYTRQLDSFSRERISILSEDAAAPRPTTPIHSSRRVKEVARGLESVEIVDEARDLNEFLGEEDDNADMQTPKKKKGKAAVVRMEDSFCGEAATVRIGKKSVGKAKENEVKEKVPERKGAAVVMADEDFEDTELGW